MLVLSRRQNEKIVFPNLGISVEILPDAREAGSRGGEGPPISRFCATSCPKCRPHSPSPEAAAARGGPTGSGGLFAADAQPAKQAQRGPIGSLSLMQQFTARGMTADAEATLETALAAFPPSIAIGRGRPRAPPHRRPLPASISQSILHRTCWSRSSPATKVPILAAYLTAEL